MPFVMAFRSRNKSSISVMHVARQFAEGRREAGKWLWNKGIPQLADRENVTV